MVLALALVVQSVLVRVLPAGDAGSRSVVLEELVVGLPWPVVDLPWAKTVANPVLLLAVDGWASTGAGFVTGAPGPPKKAPLIRRTPLASPDMTDTRCRRVGDRAVVSTVLPTGAGMTCYSDKQEYVAQLGVDSIASF